MDAYQQGAKAFRDGLDIDVNPYPESDPQWDEWEDGYCHTDIQESGDFG